MVRLFHGPEARDRAVEDSELRGRPVSEPMGDEGLSIADSRKIVKWAMQAGIGDRRPTLVVGPMDRTKSGAAVDALLKTIEEIGNKPLYLVLWADDLSGVIGTIRSRTFMSWCPAGKTWLDPLDYKEDEAKALAKAVLSQDPVRILGALEGQEKEWKDLSLALAKELASVDEEHWPVVAEVWDPLRKILDGRGSILGLADALLPQVEVT